MFWAAEKPCHRVLLRLMFLREQQVNPSAHQPPQIAHTNGIDICYEIFGEANAEQWVIGKYGQQ